MTPLALAARRFRAHRLAVASLALLAAFAAISFCGPLVATILAVDPEQVDLLARFEPPSAAHPHGTDDLGRDVLVRLLLGGRVSLTVGLVTAVLAAAIGTLVGLLAGYYGGRLDAVLMRFTDAMLSLPVLPLLIVLAAVDLGKLGLPTGSDTSLYRIVAIVALVGWTTAARLVRGAALAAREREYVRAAVALGAGPARIMLNHILPNVASPVVVAATLSVGNVILFESVLSFLGLGIQPPTPSWGNMLTNAQELIWEAPQLAIYPGLAIFATVIAFNFLGDGMQDALDPRTR